jgi:uncharacterized protein (TIGR00255 family)
MVISMTGYGRGTAEKSGLTVTVDIRSVNSRFLEVSTRLPRALSMKEYEVKEIIKGRVSRAKLSVAISLEGTGGDNIPLRVNPSVARSYYRLLTQVRKAVRLTGRVRLEHLLQFPEIFESEDNESEGELIWMVARTALNNALDDLEKMRHNEGRELERDFRQRLDVLDERIGAIERISGQQVPRERERLRDRIRQLMMDQPVDEGRLEMELALLADRLDVTEECVRFRSHTKFFREALGSGDAAGRRLNFLVQELHRETNTIGSKSSATEIAHLVVGVKEELERIREQLQNIE